MMACHADGATKPIGKLKPSHKRKRQAVETVKGQVAAASGQ